MPTSRKRPAKLEASSSSQPDSVPVNENGPRDAVPEQSPAAETGIHAPSVDESTQLATAVLLQTLAEELPKAASIRPDDGSGEATELNTNTPKQAVEESTQLASTLPQGSLKESTQPASSPPQESLKESTQQPTNSALRFLASADVSDGRRLTKTEESQTKKSDAQDLEKVTRQLLNNAALSLPDARLVIAYTRYSIPEDAEKNSAMICLQKIPGRGDMFGVVQTSKHGSFAISFPYCRRPVDERSQTTERFQLNCKIMYDPTSDDCLVLNETKMEIYITYLGLRITRTRLVEGQSGIVSPGIFTISVSTKERGGFTENRLVEILLLRKRFTVSIHGAIGPPQPGQAAIGQDGHDGRAAKRQKLSDGNMQTQVAHATKPSSESRKLSVADRGLLPAPRRIRNEAVAPILDLRDGETAVIEAPEVNITDPIGTYQLQRIEKINYTRAAGVFACLRSGMSETLVAKVVCCRTNPPILRLPDTLAMWLRETKMLETIQHRNIVSLKGADARFLAMYLEHLPSSLHQEPETPPIGPSDARKILCDMASALAYLARRGIVHHDVKPSNITWSADRGAVLIDFGMAASVTDTQSMGGSPHYIPPEYVDEDLESRGLPGDVWALGVTMLCILRRLPLEDFKKQIDLGQLRDEDSPARAAFDDLLEKIASARKQLNLEDVCEKLIFQMLEPDVKERITAADVESALRDSQALTEDDDEVEEQE